MNAARTLGAFLHASPAVRRMTLEATLFLALARALVVFVPMRHWRACIRSRPRAPQAATADSGATATARTVGRLIGRVAGRMPFDATCLSQAMASQWMLRRRGIASRLQLGVRRRADRTVAFHAWLTAAGVCVVGGPAVDTYAALSPSGDLADPANRPGDA